MKRLRVLVLALIAASTLAIGAGSAFAGTQNPDNGPGTCQNNPTGGNQNLGVPGQGCHK